MEKLFEADILRSFLPPPPVICQSLRAGSTCCALRPCQPSASCPRYFSVFVSIFQYSSVFSSSFQCFSVFFSIFQYFSVFFSIQRLYHHHCWSIFLNHQIVKGDFCASFWNTLGLWEWSKLLTLYIFTSSFLFTKKSDSRVSLVGPQWCSEEVDPAWRLCLFYVLLYYMRSLLHIFCNTCMFSITCLLCILYYLYVLFYMRSL